MNYYEKYLRREQKQDELAIFEIAGLGYTKNEARIINSLPRLNAKKVIYRGIDIGVDPKLRFREITKSDRSNLRSYSHQKLQEHQIVPSSSIDQLVIPWDAKDIPYPFASNSFDEFHCHMIDGHIIAPEQSEDYPTPESFVDEASRLLKPKGIFFLSAQFNLFFWRREYICSSKGFRRLHGINR